MSLEKADPAFLAQLIKFVENLLSNKARTGNADYVVASEGYFETLGFPLLNGRLFNQSDGPGAPHAAIISASVARQKWPNQDPLGQTIEFGNMDGDLRLLTIVGVIGEVRKHSLESAPRPTVYVNYRQRPRSAQQFDIVMRTNSDPATVYPAARRVLTQLDPAVPSTLNRFTQVFSESLNNRRFNLLLVSVFALTALLRAGRHVSIRWLRCVTSNQVRISCSQKTALRRGLLHSSGRSLPAFACLLRPSLSRRRTTGCRRSAGSFRREGAC